MLRVVHKGWGGAPDHPQRVSEPQAFAKKIKIKNQKHIFKWLPARGGWSAADGWMVPPAAADPSPLLMAQAGARGLRNTSYCVLCHAYFTICTLPFARYHQPQEGGQNPVKRLGTIVYVQQHLEQKRGCQEARMAKSPSGRVPDGTVHQW